MNGRANRRGSLRKTSRSSIQSWPRATLTSRLVRRASYASLLIALAVPSTGSAIRERCGPACSRSAIDRIGIELEAVLPQLQRPVGELVPLGAQAEVDVYRQVSR